MIIVALVALGISSAAWSNEPQVFSTQTTVSTFNTLDVSLTELSSDSLCTGGIDWARPGLDCGFLGFAALSAATLNRCCNSDCWASASGTMVVTAYIDPSTGEPLAPGSGGVPVTSFPAGTILIATGSTPPEAVAQTGASGSGTAYAELTIGSVTVSATSPLGGPTHSAVVATIDTVGVMDGSGIPIAVFGSHTGSIDKIGLARILCPPGPNGQPGYELHTPCPLGLPVPVQETSWGRIKSQQ